MNQKLLPMITAVLVVFVLIFIVTDFVSQKRWEKITGNESANNWKWNDDWQGTPVKPEPQQPQQPQQPQRLDPMVEVGDYATAIQQAKQTGKLVLVYFEADWCQYCQKMKKETLPKVQSNLAGYIVVFINTDKNRPLAQKYGVTGIPAYFIVSGNEEKLKSANGFMAADAFANWLIKPQQQGPQPTPPVGPPQKPERQKPLQNWRQRSTLSDS